VFPVPPVLNLMDTAPIAVLLPLVVLAESAYQPIAVFLVAEVFLPKASNPNTEFSTKNPPPLPKLCPDTLISLLLVIEPVILTDPVTSKKLPSNLKFVSATAAFVVPSEVSILLSAGFDTVLNPVPEVPDEPVEPEDPVLPEEPLEPVEPELPEDPLVPEVPEEPEVPVEPLDPEEPVEPDEPEVPVEPLDPVDPLLPDVPLDPLVPVLPDEPELPVEPEDPELPVVPLVPEVPVLPEDPELPEEPV